MTFPGPWPSRHRHMPSGSQLLPAMPSAAGCRTRGAGLASQGRWHAPGWLLQGLSNFQRTSQEFSYFSLAMTFNSLNLGWPWLACPSLSNLN